MSEGSGPIQVVRYSRKRSTFSPLPHTSPPRHVLKGSAAEVTGQCSIQLQYRNPRQRERGRVLFQKSVEYEAKDISELIDDDIREARRVEAELRINSGRKELQLYSERGFYSNWKLCEYQREPEGFLLRLGARPEKSQKA